eukprot:CAMPEP_0114983130 /NCGR_PEP_ID=MMETSP0216-20121206/6526_1 /TAXON_ID=223996 /ORGANISM="Protocruzia adherens, Strain Boccale" /LENGTH=419 /DNA_ID=CAMNT_0002345073 /DNA_START=117 /DNA_END=1376 /DNA_ORIENTATION=+
MRNERGDLRNVVYADRNYEKDELLEIFTSLYNKKDDLLEELRTQSERFSGVKRNIEGLPRAVESELEAVQRDATATANEQVSVEKQQATERINGMQRELDECRANMRIQEETSKKALVELEARYAGQIGSLQTELGEKKKSVEKLSRDLKSTQQKFERKSGEVSKCQGRYDNLQKMLQRKEEKHEEELEKLRSELDNKMDNVLLRDDEVILSKDELQSKDREILSLRHSVKNLNEELEEVKTTLDEKDEFHGRQIKYMKNEMENINTENYYGQQCEEDLENLRFSYSQKERRLISENQRVRDLLNQKEQALAAQKSEWAEIYGNMRNELNAMQGDMNLLTDENEHLLSQLAQSGPDGNLQYSSLFERLKDAEGKTEGLWSVFRDLLKLGNKGINSRELNTLLSMRNLNQEARTKLNAFR